MLFGSLLKASLFFEIFFLKNTCTQKKGVVILRRF